ncbi:MAG: hypothetical protein HYS34_00980 [Acidobacteria bacterium]|nr:hypothetical protein [Acidobacteriota bacterium]
MKRAAPGVLLALLLAGLYVLAAKRVAGAAGFPLDDAWIHARLARNLSEGGGLAFNAGEPAAVSSAPLWTLLVYLPAAAGVPFPWASFLAGALLAGALPVLAFRLVQRAVGDRSAAWFSALLLAGTHPMPWSSVSGMETPLAAALVAATLLAALSARPGASLVLAGAAGLARPELVLLPVFVLADVLWRERALRRPRVVGLAIGALLAGIAPFAVNRALAGAWLFSSFAAKVGRHGMLAALLEGRADAVPSVMATNLPLYLAALVKALGRDNAALLLLVPIGLWRLAAGRGGSHLPWMVFVLLPCFMAVLAPFGGPEFHEQRYIGPLVAVMVLAGCVALAALPPFLKRPAARLPLMALIAALSVPGAWTAARRYAIEVKNITEMQVTVGRWLAERPGGPGTIATNDIGAIGFLTRAPILDLTGLASPDAIPYLRRPPPAGSRNRGWNGASESGLVDFMRERRPGYVAVFPAWYPGRSFHESLGAEVFRVTLEDNLICGDRTMIVYRPSWNGARGRLGGSLRQAWRPHGRGRPARRRRIGAGRRRGPFPGGCVPGGRPGQSRGRRGSARPPRRGASAASPGPPGASGPRGSGDCPAGWPGIPPGHGRAPRAAASTRPPTGGARGSPRRPRAAGRNPPGHKPHRGRPRGATNATHAITRTHS